MDLGDHFPMFFHQTGHFNALQVTGQTALWSKPQCWIRFMSLGFLGFLGFLGWILDECWTMLDLWMGFFDSFWGCFLMAFWMAMDAMVGTAIFERWNCHWNCQVAWLHGKLLVADRCALRQVQRRSGRVFDFRLFF